jgi:hypothetical protein
MTPARLPEDLAHNLESRFPDVRIGAVNAIAAWLTDPDPARRLAALRALEDVVENDVRRVSEAARSHVDTTSLSEVHAEPASVMSAGPLPRKGAVTATAVRYRLIARKGRRPVSPPGAMGARWVPRRAVAALEGYAGTVRGVAFSPDGELIAAAGSDGKVGLWNGTNRKPLPSLTGHIGQVTGLAFSQTQPLLVSASSDRTVRLWQ